VIPIDEPIHVHEYVLQSGSPLNSASVRRLFPGALIRIGDGFGAIHPWPEFGDDPIELQLEKLAAGQLTPQTEKAVQCAIEDGEARRSGTSLFEGLPIPVSHYSWSFAKATAPQMDRVLSEGWPAIKAKGFPHWGETLRFVESCARVADGSDLMLRVDFNGCLERSHFERFIEFMALKAYRRIDVIEDPFPYDAEAWQACRDRWGVALALDKGWQSASGGFDAVVVKPARRDWRVVAEKFPQSPLILTSAMDHPLGQTFAAYQAALAWRDLGDSRISLCGLCTPHLFETDPFSERIQTVGGQFTPDTIGGGLGFGDLLEGLPWRRLN
jgi:O-succinylbenzoate synthase